MFNICLLLSLPICSIFFCFICTRKSFIWGICKNVSSAKGFRSQIKLGNIDLNYIVSNGMATDELDRTWKEAVLT